jgi:hypothetical protein
MIHAKKRSITSCLQYYLKVKILTLGQTPQQLKPNLDSMSKKQNRNVC